MNQSTLFAAITAVAGIVGALTIAVAGDAAKVQHGKQLFNYSCISCHGSGPGNRGPGTLPGTLALQLKYQGSEPPVLEDRKDLQPAFIKSVVRHGIQAMPPYRKTEISDAELEDLAEYLSRNTP